MRVGAGIVEGITDPIPSKRIRKRAAEISGEAARWCGGVEAVEVVEQVRGDAPGEQTAAILVVEDNLEVRELIQVILEEEGLPVETAADGGEAVDLIAKRRPALVTLDLNLPVLGGDGVARVLQTMYDGSVPIVLISSDDRLAERARLLGATDYLRKPFDVDDLIAVVRRALPPRAA